jgi:hypothetical protein
MKEKNMDRTGKLRVRRIIEITYDLIPVGGYDHMIKEEDKITKEGIADLIRYIDDERFLMWTNYQEV